MWNRQGTLLIILIKEILIYHLICITYVGPYIYIYILKVDLLLEKAIFFEFCKCMCFLCCFVLILAIISILSQDGNCWNIKH